MKIAVKTLILIILFFFSSFTKKDKDNFIIKWDANRPLKLTDYTVKQQIQNNSVALSYVGITIHSALGDKVMTVEIYAYFDKRGSWISKGYVDTTTLNHEQVHFDIGEVYARKFRQQLLSMKFTADNFITKSNSIYKTIMKSLKKEQTQYDKDIKKEENKKQIEWNEKVKNELMELDEYKDNIISIPLSD
jgi:hypothetical protein